MTEVSFQIPPIPPQSQSPAGYQGRVVGEAMSNDLVRCLVVAADITRIEAAKYHRPESAEWCALCGEKCMS